MLGPFYRPGAPWIENPGSIVRETGVAPAGVVRGTVADARSGGPSPAPSSTCGRPTPRAPTRTRTRGSTPGTCAAASAPTPTDGTRSRPSGRSHYTVKHDGPVGQLLEALERHPWRPAHIHFLVEADGYRRLVTQAYPAGGRYLEDDTINGVKSELIVPVEDGVLTFDIELEPDAAAR